MEPERGGNIVETELVKRLASEAGFDICGVARCRELVEHTPHLDRWLSEEMHSGLGYMERNREKRAAPAQLFEGTQTVIVCGVNIRNVAFRQHSPDRPKIASYALAQDYHISIKQMLNSLLDGLRDCYPGVSGRAFTDSAPILEKAWAVEAGLGWIGHNSLFISPEFGSTVLLGELLINAPADRYDEPFKSNYCGGCRRCMKMCPNGAICEPRIVDTRRCISRMTIERGGEYASQELHGWLFGCDECQLCCPHNGKDKQLLRNHLFAPKFDYTELDAKFWMSLDEEKFKEQFGETPISRVDLATIKKRIAALSSSLPE